MKIRRLSLQSWRGISRRDITLGDGVTLIEGANEIGKSTLVEALRMLIREQDSSKKKEVRAIQPVGEDVGSSVEAEIECGEAHFTYSKTYNRRAKTELHIHAPRTEHLTGGDAHNRARAILDEHMDVGLWETLLVEQGQALGAINLADSSGLAQALDAASGGQGNDGDGSVLLEAARAEYEHYFTPSAGKERFLDQVAEVERLESEVTRLRDLLNALDDDLLALERLDNEIRQRQQSLPDLEANETALRERWSAIDRLELDIAQARETRAPMEA
ncbi:MAG: AAA family ATPase, partial [Chromatocurvus sp.]